MSFGLDYVVGPPIAAMKAAGVSFVCRYLSEVNELTRIKLLTKSEAQALHAAGIATVSNYEWYANRSLESFASGVQDAQIAASQHADCGGPSDRPIYFSVDVDVAGEQVAGYFHGAASVLGKSRTGAYGSFRVLHYLFNAGLIDWGWQTYAWSYGAWEPRAQLQQYLNSVTIAGHSVDYNRSMQADFGQWGIDLKGIDMALTPDDPMITKYYHAANGALVRKDTGATLPPAFANFYLKYGGPAVLRLNISSEIAAQDSSGTAIGGVSYVIMESCIIVHDKERKIDRPPTTEECYLLHLDKGPGQTLIATPLVTPLQQQVAQLKNLLSAEQQKVAPPDPILQQKIDNLKALVATL